MYCEMFVTSQLFVLFVFELNATIVGEALQGHDEVGGET